MLLKTKLPIGWFNEARSLKACEAFRARPIKRAEWVDKEALSKLIYLLPADLRVLAEQNKLDLLEFNAYGRSPTTEILIHPDKFFKLIKRKVGALIRRE